jgi:hypothetical protein
MKDELEKIWKDAVVTHFKMLAWHSSARNEKNQESLSQGSLF